MCISYRSMVINLYHRNEAGTPNGVIAFPRYFDYYPNELNDLLAAARDGKRTDNVAILTMDKWRDAFCQARSLCSNGDTDTIYLHFIGESPGSVIDEATVTLKWNKATGTYQMVGQLCNIANSSSCSWVEENIERYGGQIALDDNVGPGVRRYAYCD